MCFEEQKRIVDFYGNYFCVMVLMNVVFGIVNFKVELGKKLKIEIFN